jgi:hypothetical protein
MAEQTVNQIVKWLNEVMNDSSRQIGSCRTDTEALLPLQSRLYLSPGALEAAREIKLVFTLHDAIPAAQLPATTLLLHGEGVARGKP